MHLTDLAIQKLKPPPTGQKSYFDNQFPGFGVRITYRGTKSFIIMYGRYPRRLKTLGRYPDMPLKAAREAARAFLTRYTTLPYETRHMAFPDALERFLTESATRVKPKTVIDYRRHLTFFPFKKPIREISRQEILNRLADLSNRPTTQVHHFTTIVTFYNWALRNELVDRHPLQGERKPAVKKSRDRVLTPDELKAVYLRAVEYPFPYGHICRLLALTGQRRSEITHLTWDDVGDTLRFFDTKNKTDHEIPLMPMARAVIEEITPKGRYLFENTKDVPFSAFSRAKIEFDKGLDVQDYRLHDLRRTFSSVQASLGTPLHVTERILNHKSGVISGIAAVYNVYSYQREAAEALMTYEDFLSKLLRT
jgi:integrase